MRFRKSKGNKKAVLTMTENEIVDACIFYLKSKKYFTSNKCSLSIPLKDNIDRLGRKRRRGVEFHVELDE